MLQRGYDNLLPTARERMNAKTVQTLGRLGATGGAVLVYNPDLGAVGSGSGYYPRSVASDADALTFLCFMSDGERADIEDTTGSAASDMANGTGAWHPSLRSGVLNFQDAVSPAAGKVDGWLGPNTRRAIASAVAIQNAKNGAKVIVDPALPVIPPGALPNVPGGLVSPASDLDAPEGMSLGAKVGIGVGVVGLLGAAWYLLK